MFCRPHLADCHTGPVAPSCRSMSAQGSSSPTAVKYHRELAAAPEVCLLLVLHITMSDLLPMRDSADPLKFFLDHICCSRQPSKVVAIICRIYVGKVQCVACTPALMAKTPVLDQDMSSAEERLVLYICVLLVLHMNSIETNIQVATGEQVMANTTGG